MSLDQIAFALFIISVALAIVAEFAPGAAARLLPFAVIAAAVGGVVLAAR